MWLQSWVGKIPGRRNWQPTPAFLPGDSLGQRSLMGYKTSDMTEHTHCAELPEYWSLAEQQRFRVNTEDL